MHNIHLQWTIAYQNHSLPKHLGYFLNSDLTLNEVHLRFNLQYSLLEYESIFNF